MSAAGRLLAEYHMFAQQTTPSIFARPDENDLLHWSALIVGPPHSPYASGLFHFDMRFPPDYPNSPPAVQILTTSHASVRFNPNLYHSGKVCLSTLGTWQAQSGEQWSSVQNVMSVLLSIQSLLHDKPYHNEPGFECDDGSGSVERYNEKVAHESLRVAVAEVMEDTLDSGASAVRNGASPAFADLRKQLFSMCGPSYLRKIEAWMASDDEHVHDGKQFKMMPFEMEPNQMTGVFQWRALHERIVQLRARLNKEVAAWRVLGCEQAELLKTTRTIGLLPAVSELVEQFSQLQLDGVDNVLISDMTDNALVRELTLLGPEGTSWEGGCFQVEIVFPPSWPEMSPRVRFVTPVFHPNISVEGLPYLSTLLLWHGVSGRQRTVKSLLNDILALLVRDPDPEPITHLNWEAAELYFASPEAKKLYHRRARRCAQQSTE